MTEKNRFLNHVNGLRGLCILLVVLFHMLTVWCPLGYLGVDAFFVIAGYFLIRPMMGRMESGTFGWTGYYGGKFLRIVPVLVVVVLLTMVCIVLLQPPGVIKILSKDMRMAVLGISNISFGIQATDYFSPDVKGNPFLHTWYISALLQMLLVAPLVVWLFVRRPTLLCRVAVLGLMLVSAVIFFQDVFPQGFKKYLPYWLENGGSLGSVYYMTLGRVWELLAGACVASLPAVGSRGGRAVLLVLGLGLLVVPALGVLGECQLFPLAAVCGTMFVIRYGENTPMDRLLQNRVLMWLGTVSFSLYMVHWAVYAVYCGVLHRDSTLMEGAVLLVVALPITWLIYRFVESRRYSLWKVLLFWLLALGVSLFLRKTSVLEDALRTVDKPLGDYSMQAYYSGCHYPRPSEWVCSFPRSLHTYAPPAEGKALPGQAPNQDCHATYQIGDETADATFVILGDSYANATYGGMDTVAREEGWSGIYPLLYVSPIWGRNNMQDPKLNFTQPRAETLMTWLAANPKIRYVVLIQRWKLRFEPFSKWSGEPISPHEAWDYSARGLREFCRRLKLIGKTPILVMPTPEAPLQGGFLLSDMVYTRSILGPKVDMSCTWEQYLRQNGRIRELMQAMETEGLCLTVDPAPGLFQNGVFDPVEGDHLLLVDYGHVSLYGAIKVANSLREQLGHYLRPSPKADAAVSPASFPASSVPASVEPAASADSVSE